MIKPLGERVVIEVAESDVKTASGIVLPDTAKEKPQKGTVVAVGAGKLRKPARSRGAFRPADRSLALERVQRHDQEGPAGHVVPPRRHAAAGEDHRAGDRLAAPGQFAQRRGFQVAVDGERYRARDWGRGHHQ